MESHQHLLGELKVEVDNLVPTIPEEIEQKAQSKLKKLSEQPEPEEEEIRKVMHEVGYEEFPYRKAYNEMKQDLEVNSATGIALENIDDELEQKLREKLKDGQDLHDLTKEMSFEDQFDAQENHQIEQKIIDARNEREQRVAKKIKDQQEQYEQLVEKWKQKQEEINSKIEQLEQMSESSPKWSEEIEDEVENFQEKWSIVDPDPNLETVSKRVDYWQEKNQESQEESSANGEGEVEIKEET